jgi:hypothetical protein
MAASPPCRTADPHSDARERVGGNADFPVMDSTEASAKWLADNNAPAFAD